MKRAGKFMHTRRVTIFALAFFATYGAAAVAQKPEIPPAAFDSPEAAAKALIDAAAKDDTNALTAVLGSAAKGILTSGDANRDREERQKFTALASAKNHIEHSSMNSDAAVLLVGEDDWPFPIPLIRTGQQWHFDPERGAVEVRARRIGANELDAIEICKGYVAAQRAYAAQASSGGGTPVYAQRITSAGRHKDGLYQDDAANKLIPEGFAMSAASAPGRERKPYHGYFFRVLKEQGPNAPGGKRKYVTGGAMTGGFALIAWPAEYGQTGIHSFIVSQDGIVFEKDFGSETARLTGQIVSYDPDSSWTEVDY